MEGKRINSYAAIDTGLGLFKGHRDQGLEKSRTPYIKENSIIKIGIDLSFFVVLWLTLLCVLPRNALFFHISQRQTTTPKLAFTIATTAIVLVLFRLLLKNYGLSMIPEGSGIAVRQSVAPNVPVVRGTEITVYFEPR